MARQTLKREAHAAHFPAFEGGAPSEVPSTRAPFHTLVKRLSEAYGPSGSEDGVREMVRAEIKEYVDQMRVDAMGNLIASRRGSGTHRKKIMFAAHLDEIGVMITFVDTRGFARFGTLGAVKPLTLLGARVQFENGAIGVIGRNEKNAPGNEIEMDALFIDLGAAGGDNVPLSVGESACLARDVLAMGETLVGKALSGRSGCAVLIETVRQLKRSPHDLFFVFTVQQKIGARGAGAAAFAIQPDLAFVMDAAEANDVPAATTNGSAANSLALGKGPAIKFQDDGALTTASAREFLIQAARDLRVAHQADVSAHTGGDALPIQAAREGVPTGILAVPIRYLNTASEVLNPADMSSAVKILLELASRKL